LNEFATNQLAVTALVINIPARMMKTVLFGFKHIIDLIKSGIKENFYLLLKANVYLKKPCFKI
jgi:hypothetical protein